jgi:hypothetical protein
LYFWKERSRGEDQCYFVVRKRGNFVVVNKIRWVVDDHGINTFLYGLGAGQDEAEPVMESTVILRHPIMEVESFQAAYRAAAPELEWW